MEKVFSRIPDTGMLPPNLKGGVVAIGNFDGVHRGHQAVLAAALEIAEAKSLPALVLTFEPHPRTVFKPKSPVFRLTDAYSKARILGRLGFDGVVEQTFDKAFAATSAEDFVREILVDGFEAAHVVTGHDFHFGNKREGDPKFLKAAGKRHGFGTSQVEAFADESGKTVSSSRVREMLANGDVSSARGLLGYAYQTTGLVAEGKKLGRTLGYPTANMTLPPETELKHGIYAVRTIAEDGMVRNGVANYGRRPTFDNGNPLLETHIFDFTGELYNELMTVCFYTLLRTEEKFDDVNALVAQMEVDSREARSFLSSLEQEEGVWPLMAGAVGD